MKVTGKEKAFVGGLGAGITALAGQLSVGTNITPRVIVVSLGTWLATHLFVYYTSNSPVEPVAPPAPEATVVPPVNPPAPTDPAPSV